MEHLVNLPYGEPHDCYGLVRQALQDLAGIALPAKQYSTDADERAALLTAGLPGWVQVPRPRQFDVVVLRHNGRPGHVGLCLGSDRFLHVQEGGRSRIDRFGPFWQVESFHRFEGTP